MQRYADPLRKKLGLFIKETDFSRLPDQVIRQAKLCLMDLIGVGIAGSRQPTSAIAKELCAKNSLPEEATLWVSDQKISASAASFLNAVQSHAIDMDDGHRYANGHPGVVTIPAAVALAEREGLGGRELLEAMVIGYEVFIRLGRTINPDLLNRGFHTTATVGTFASAAVAAKLLGLTSHQIENALSLAGLQSAGLLEALSSGEMGKSFQVGKATQSGVLAAMLARRGADGPEKIFEGAKGFFKAFAEKNCDADSICKHIGTEFHITGVYFKKHAACRHIHSALDATAEILKRHRIGSHEIESIEVETYTIAKNLTGHLAPEGSELAAKFSMPVAIGLLAGFGRTDAASFSKENISNATVQSIARKVSVRVKPERDAAYPGQRGALVRIAAKGQSFQKEVLYPKGEPEQPLSIQELAEKYQANAGLVFPSDVVNQLQEGIMNVEFLKVSDLTRLLKAP